MWHFWQDIALDKGEFGLSGDNLVVDGLPNSNFLEGGRIVKKNYADDWQLHI